MKVHVLFILSSFNMVFAAQKQYRLSMLTMIPFTGAEPRDGKICRAAMQLVVDMVNNRTDILPRYKIEPDFRDETANSIMASRLAVDFARKFEGEPVRDQEVFPSPVLIGPTYTPGCKSFDNFPQFLNMVTIVPACLSPFFSDNRRIYPNLYRTRIAGELVIFARLAFIKEIGRWKKLALFANPNNNYNIYMAIFFQEKARSEGIEITWFDATPTITDEMMASLKASGSRVIFLDIAEGTVAFTFLCKAYQFGITGEAYAFLLSMNVFVEPSSLPDPVIPGCPRSAIIEQLKISFFIGPLSKAIADNGKTTLGYGISQFENLLDSYINRLRSPDYESRHSCHDRMLQSIMTLAGAERILGQQNASLKDFQTNPKMVMSAANLSAANIDFVGLLFGRFKYSQRLEMDDQPQYTAQWTEDTGFQMVQRLAKKPGAKNVSELSSFESAAIEKVVWATRRNKPPRDSSFEIDVIDEVDIEPFAISVAVAGLISLAQLLFRAITFAARLELASIFPRSRLAITTLSLLTINVGAVCFTTAIDDNGHLCIIRPVLTALGISLLNCFVFARLAFSSHRQPGTSLLIRIGNMSSGSMMTHWRKRSASQKPARSTHHHALSSKSSASSAHHSGNWLSAKNKSETAKPLSPERLADDRRQRERRVFLCCIIYLLFVLALLAAWFRIDPPRLTVIPVKTNYEAGSDTYERIFVRVCRSEYLDLVMTAALVAIQAPILVSSIFLAYEMRHDTDALEAVPDLRMLMAAGYNCTTLFAGSVLILIILRGSPIAQQTFTAFVMLLLSALTELIFVVPVCEQLKQNGYSTIGILKRALYCAGGIEARSRSSEDREDQEKPSHMPSLFISEHPGGRQSTADATRDQ